MAKTLIRKRKSLKIKETPYAKRWEKVAHIYGGKANVPHNIKEGVKKFFRGQAKDPLA